MASPLPSSHAEIENLNAVHPSLSPSNSDTESLNAPSTGGSPPISLANPAFSSPVSTYAEPQSDEVRIQDVHIHATASPDGTRFSVSSNSEEEMLRQHACDILVNGAAASDQQNWEASPIRVGSSSNEGYEGDDGNSRCRGDNANPNQLGVDIDSSGSDADVEKGCGSGNAKQVIGEEDGRGDGCRVCHLTVERSPSSGEIIKLGCACKDDLALAHRHCAETWFNIKGNQICEICGSTARNILGSGDANFMDQWNDGETSHVGLNRAERCWQNQPLCNTLLVCVILVLIASWLFRVTRF